MSASSLEDEMSAFNCLQDSFFFNSVLSNMVVQVMYDILLISGFPCL